MAPMSVDCRMLETILEKNVCLSANVKWYCLLTRTIVCWKKFLR